MEEEEVILMKEAAAAVMIVLSLAPQDSANGCVALTPRNTQRNQIKTRSRVPNGMRPTLTGVASLKRSCSTSSNTFPCWTEPMPLRSAAAGTRPSTCLSCGDALSLSSPSRPAPT